MAATVQLSLQGATLYPLPQRTLEEVATRRGLTLSAEATQAVLTGSTYNLALADILVWLALAPDVSQGGQTYGFTDEQRTQLRNRASLLYKKFAASDEEDTSSSTTVYGYKGSRL